METHFAPAGRDTREELEQGAVLVEKTALLGAVLDAIPSGVLILNEKRQVLAANRSLLRMLDVRREEILGKRPGEIVGCAFWSEGSDGCGTGTHCLTCGAVQAILDSQSHPEPVTRECRLTLDGTLGGGARDLRVTASALALDSRRFTLCTIEDCSQQKRLAVLTRIFFHDVLNTAGCVRGYAQLLTDSLPKDWQETEEARRLAGLVDQLIEEIESQRDLTRAESGELAIDPVPVEVRGLLGDLTALYSAHDAAQDRTIAWANVWEGSIVSDGRLLARVLGNMLKNALEATEPGGTVTIGCSDLGREAAFHVHNDSVMPAEVQLQVFHRSFSTKATIGRGIGTYSMKLFGEHYLRGRIEFTSRASEGTTFNLYLPKMLESDGARSGDSGGGDGREEACGDCRLTAARRNRQ